MCLSRHYKAPEKAVNKLHLVKKHELLATTTMGKATTRVVSPSIYNRRQQKNDAVLLTQSTILPSLDSSSSMESASALSTSQHSSDDSISPSPLDAFDFDISFLQIPTGGVICIPRQEEISREARTSGPSFTSDMTTPTMHNVMKPDPFDFSSLHQILGSCNFKQEAVLVTPSTAVTNSARDFQGDVSSADFVYATPRMQRETMTMLTPPTTPRMSGHDCIFVDAARLYESLLIPML